MYTRKQRGKRNLTIPIIIGIIIIGLAGFLIYSLINTDNEAEELDLANMEEINFFDFNRGYNPNIIHIGMGHNLYAIENEPVFVDGILYLPADFLLEFDIDRHVFWENNSNRLTISKINADNNIIIRFVPNELIYTINWQEHSLTNPIITIGEMAYLPVDLIMELYSVNIRFEEEYNLVLVDLPFNSYRIYEIRFEIDEYSEENEEDVWIPARLGGDNSYPIAARLYNGDVVQSFIGFAALSDYDYLKVRLESGITAWVHFDNLQLISEYFAQVQPAERHPQTRPSFDGSVNMLWQFVDQNTTHNIGALYAPLGVNVISPYWFLFYTEVITDGDGDEDNNIRITNGDIRSLANHPYVNWAHSNGLEIWPMLTDNFISTVSRTSINTAQTRDHVISQIMAFIEEYNLDGINIDYEAVREDFAHYWVQFMRELSVPMREAGAILSVALKVPAPWNMFWNRYEIGLVVDYVVIMAYDEHWGTSPTAGSTASFPFVQDGVINTLREVPAERVVVGLPTYVRIFREITQEDGSIVVNHYSAVGMQAARNFIDSRGGTFEWDYIARQYYGEFITIENGLETRYRLWLADLQSHAEKFALIRQFDLAGVAFWQKSLALPDMWELLQDFLP